MGMSEFYGSADEAEAEATIRRALELGVSFLDTADMYGPFTNEELVGRTIAGRRDQVVPATWRSWSSRARCATSASPRRGRRRSAAPTRIHPITALQTEYSLWSRDLEEEILPTLRELGIGFVPYSPLGRGFLTGRFRSPDDLEEGDFRRVNPRFEGENFERNMRLVERGRGDRRREGRQRRAAGTGLGAGAGRRPGADPRHQAPQLPGGERRRDGDRVERGGPAPTGRGGSARGRGGGSLRRHVPGRSLGGIMSIDPPMRCLTSTPHRNTPDYFSSKEMRWQGAGRTRQRSAEIYGSAGSAVSR